MEPPRVLATAAALLVAAGGLVGCGLDGNGSSSDVDRPMTHRALAAAVIDHVGEDASAAAPLFPRDRVPSNAIGVEVAFPRAEGDSTHVRAVVTPAVKTFARSACDLRRNRYLNGCEEDTVDGVDTVLGWQQETPEEDPGVISVVARHHNYLVSVYAYGPAVPADLGDLRGFADDLVALAADKAVGFETSADYAAEGDDIPDDVWLDWYGQGNGYPAPKGYGSSDG